ncbi:hypothetical protein A2631_03555 [Candidatus Daviesbacteria bacterium RIFCSPHIGHO2_01_FULL_44_29]|uniref:Uncharacterized protein n=1 Tax=Candidatus Daviesbacteria bacterium RIFCSPHIGHO2_02_FULL_43_12 TaxID=1797776 RepID=A0A1F5KFI8_9BACT|nr:MAG: hypothetical protein A2631_03555 [Candidatus Daviesbacteria bacterium RIFCSPHIGHO2_01_FULL_44_29]OGE38825.1 MAG: hypothetical protein A3E86_02830 [Candidatus Daviesbacteria bacterium RIFCSPHIGHO2_12_FULL_47_45]OGE39722.1 MAG: hypothetical protein A3D25_03270 [Candidatus Daviesbacteria bacterium RIFCSPHIGHO2_02_FULL_43_12]OGE69987.1 MAG: hypothetical protein A3B55_04820 [Candidatus Daviesbacteria bacterium RIFCSPLOWO2_01_FULL_43_15]
MIEIKRFVNQYQLYIWPFFGLVLVILLCFFVMVPQIKALLKAREVFVDISQKAVILEQKADDLQLIDEQEVKNDLQIALSSLPAQKELISAVSQVQLLTATSNLDLKDVSFGSVSSNQEADGFVIKASVEGTIESFKNFIALLKVAPLTMSLEGIELSKTKTEGVFQTVFALKSYYQNIPISLGDVSIPLALLSDSEKEQLKKIGDYYRNIPITTIDNAEGVKGKLDPFH